MFPSGAKVTLCSSNSGKYSPLPDLILSVITTLCRFCPLLLILILQSALSLLFDGLAHLPITSVPDTGLLGVNLTGGDTL